MCNKHFCVRKHIRTDEAEAKMVAVGVLAGLFLVVGFIGWLICQA